MAISKADDQTVMKRGHWRCEYCHTQKVIVITLHIDHIIPKSKGGTDDLENLCCVCIQCNQHKSAAIDVYDPELDQIGMLFNPRTQVWADHFTWSEDGLQILAKTAIGRVTIERLFLNHPDVVLARHRRVAVGIHPKINMSYFDFIGVVCSGAIPR
jgi:hypothetical protein